MRFVRSNGQPRTPEGTALQHWNKHSASPSCIPVGQRPYLGGVQDPHPASTLSGEPPLRNFAEVLV